MDKEKDGSISIGKLPLVLQELANGDRPARQVSPCPSFTFSGTPDSDAEGLTIRPYTVMPYRDRLPPLANFLP